MDKVKRYQRPTMKLYTNALGSAKRRWKIEFPGQQSCIIAAKLQYLLNMLSNVYNRPRQHTQQDFTKSSGDRAKKTQTRLSH